MRHSAWLLVAVMAAGCTLPLASGQKGGQATTGGSSAAGAKAGNTPAAIAGKQPGGAAPLSKARLQQLGIVHAIQSTLVAGDLGRSQNTIKLLSDNGLGLISDNGLGLISDNGLGVISNNGNGYRVAAATNPEIYYENTSESGPLAWHTVFFRPDYHGEIKAYDKVEYKAKGDAAMATEHYTWGALGIDLKDPAKAITQSFPMDARLTYIVTPVKTTRFGFIKTMTLKFDMTIKAIEPPPAKVIHNGFECAYDMEVPLADGTKDVLRMDSYDLVFDPGEGPGGGLFYAPRSFKAKGANDRGSLDMTAQRLGNATEGESAMKIAATHTDKGTSNVSKLALDVHEDGSTHSVVTDVANGVEAVLDFTGTRTGTGKVQTVGAKEELGTIAWGKDGLGTITFKDGTTEKVRVF